jgi:hypothetical protein
LRFQVVDYSPALFGSLLPPVRSGKFIQIVDADEELEVLVLSPYDLSKFHAQILERYCRLNDVEGRFVRKPDHYRVTRADIEIVGGGHWRIDESLRRLVLSGRSTAYGPYDPSGLPERIKALPEFRGYVVEAG